MSLLGWLFGGDDDANIEYWQNPETGETVEVERDGPPLYEIPAVDIPDQPLSGPPG